MMQIRSIPYSALDGMKSVLAGRHLSSRFPLLRAVYDKLDVLLFRLTWSHGHLVDVQGSKMYVDVSHPDPAMRQTFRHYAIHRVHEEATTALFRQVVKEGDTVLDLGANIGYFSLLAASLVGPRGAVYSFEPEPRNNGYLCKNIALNEYRHVTATNKAVSDKPGTVKLFKCPYDTGHHTINQFGGIRSYNPEGAGNTEYSVEIEAVRLDDFIGPKATAVNVIKMDVEGAEALALAGMDGLIRANKNLIMFIEFFPLLIKEMGQSPEEFARRLLEDFGFTMSVVGDDYSMSGRHVDDGLVRIRSVEELMNLCGGWSDHLNLFLQKSA